MVLALSLCLGLAGCASTTRGNADIAPVAAAPSKPALYGLVKVQSQGPTYDEYRIPQSCTPGAYDTRFLVAADGWANEGRGSLGVLDMDTNSFATVVDKPINEGFTLITSRGSNRWVAWEEMRGNEQTEPWDIEWRLYAAPILEDGPSIGPAELVASSVTSIHSRPLFQVVDDTVYWLTNSAPNPRQEGAVRGSLVKSFDLVAKERRVLYQSNLNTHTAYVSGNQLIVSAYLDSAKPAQQVRVIDLASGVEAYRRDLDNGNKDISHWPTYREGYLVWGELGSTSVRPTLMIASGDEERRQLTSQASDPVFVGDSMAFETTSSIDVANLLTKERYTLYRQVRSDQPLLYVLPAQPWRESVLVIWGTNFGHPDDPAAATIVRRYRF